MFAINERNKIYKEFSEEKNPDSKNYKYNTYKEKRNLVTSRLKKAKQYYIIPFFKKIKITLRIHGKASET